MIPSQDIPAVAVSADLMVRWRLFPSPAAPHGRLQPYLLAGPALLITDPDTLGTTLGLKVGGGLALQLFRHLALFAGVSFHAVPARGKSGELTYEATVQTHHALAGGSLRF